MAMGSWPADLILALGLSAPGVHKHLRELQAQGLIEKKGKPPHVRYFASVPQTSQKAQAVLSALSAGELAKLEEHYCYFTPAGQKLRGLNGFVQFLESTNQAQDISSRIREYLAILETAEKFHEPGGLIDGTRKISDTFDVCHLAKLYYSAFYGLPKYGKTIVGQLLQQATYA
jgi:DNA-binding MarR family transcriptional regulator